MRSTLNAQTIIQTYIKESRYKGLYALYTSGLRKHNRL